MLGFSAAACLFLDFCFFLHFCAYLYFQKGLKKKKKQKSRKIKKNNTSGEKLYVFNADSCMQRRDQEKPLL